MTGSTKGQVIAVVKEMFEEGYDKHSAKSELSGTNAEKCEHMKIGSFQTMEKFRYTFFSIANFAKQECGIRDITKIDTPTINKWIDTQVKMYNEGGLTEKTFGDKMTALHRFEIGINMFQTRVGGDKVDWHESRDYGREQKSDMQESESRIRAYERPEDLANAPNLSANEKTLVNFFLESGCRISEAWKMKESDINGDTVTLHGKGGLDRDVESPSASKALEALTELKAEGYTQNDFRDALKEASALTGQDYNGAHGLRHNYAIENYNQEIKNGATSDEAKKVVSEKLGHFRPDITEVYLK